MSFYFSPYLYFSQTFNLYLTLNLFIHLFILQILNLKQCFQQLIMLDTNYKKKKKTFTRKSPYLGKKLWSTWPHQMRRCTWDRTWSTSAPHHHHKRTKTIPMKHVHSLHSLGFRHVVRVTLATLSWGDANSKQPYNPTFPHHPTAQIFSTNTIISPCFLRTPPSPAPFIALHFPHRNLLLLLFYYFFIIIIIIIY